MGRAKGQKGGWQGDLPIQGMSLNALSEKRCLDAVVCFRGLLPGLLGRFEGEPMLVEEYMKLLRRVAVDVIGELAALAVDWLYAQLPDNLHFCMTIGRKGIGQRDQADVVLLRNVLDVMLDNKAAADHFDIDGHAFAIFGSRSARSDVSRRATLVFGIRQAKQPIGEVHFLYGRVDDCSEAGLGNGFATHDNILLLGGLFVRGRSFQRVRVLAVEHELTSLVMHRRPRGYDARVSLRCQLNDFELGIQCVPRMYLLQESTRGARKRKKHVADVLREEGGTRSSEGENLQSMHHRSSMPVSVRVLDIVVDRVIVSRNCLESGGMRIRQCAAWGAEYVADA